MNCPKCSTSVVKRNGVIKNFVMTKTGKKSISIQTFKCENGHSFRDKKESEFSDSFIEFVVYIYLRCLSLNTTIDIVRAMYESELLTKGTILNFIERVADQLPTLNEVDRIFLPQRSGYLALDGTWFSYGDKEIVLLVCFDPETFDVIDAIWKHDEDEEGYTELIKRVLQKISLKNIKGIYGDGDLGLIRTVKNELTDIPFQVCIVHKELRMGQLVPVKRVHTRNKMAEEVKVEIIEFQKLFREVIYADTKDNSIKALEILKKFTDNSKQERLKKAYRSLKRNFKYTLTHFEYPGMMRDNNLIECFNGCIKPRLDLMRGFKKEENIDRYIKLFLHEFRFRPLRESRFKERRDQSPLECGGVLIAKHYNFITFLRQTFGLTFQPSALV